MQKPRISPYFETITKAKNPKEFRRICRRLAINPGIYSDHTTLAEVLRLTFPGPPFAGQLVDLDEIQKITGLPEYPMLRKTVQENGIEYYRYETFSGKSALVPKPTQQAGI